MVPVGILVGQLGLVPVLASFEVSAAMEDCASASFAFACPSCSVRSVIFVPCLLPWCDPIALQWQGLPGNDYDPVSFSPTLRRLPNFWC